MFGSLENTKPLSECIGITFPGEWGEDDSDGTGVNVIRTTNFTNSGKLDLTNVVTRKIDQAKIDKKHLIPDDIILERSGGTADNPVGRVVYFEAIGTFLSNNFTQLLRCKDGVNSLFVFYSLYNYYHTYKSEIRSMGNKTTGIQNLKMDKYWDIPIADASPELQDQFMCLYKQADKSKFSDFKSRFIEMFGNLSREPLLDIGTSWDKGQPFKKDSIIENGSRPCIHYGELYKYGPIIDRVVSRTNEAAIKKSKTGDILFPASDVTPYGLARCSALMKDGVLLGGDIIVFRISKDNSPEYVSYAINLQQDQLIRRVTGSVVRHMSAKSLKTVEIPIPSLDAQLQFVSLLRQTDKSKYLN
jgi:restriction endonuclease S subunit